MSIQDEDRIVDIKENMHLYQQISLNRSEKEKINKLL